MQTIIFIIIIIKRDPQQLRTLSFEYLAMRDNSQQCLALIMGVEFYVAIYGFLASQEAMKYVLFRLPLCITESFKGTHECFYFHQDNIPHGGLLPLFEFLNA